MYNTGNVGNLNKISRYRGKRYLPTHSSGIPDQDPSDKHTIVSSPSMGIGNSSLQLYWITDPGDLSLLFGMDVLCLGTASQDSSAEIFNNDAEWFHSLHD